MIEEEQNASRGEPEIELRSWLEKHAEADRKRDGYLDLAAEGLMSREELPTKSATLEEIRQTAERELEAIRERKERLEALEQDKICGQGSQAVLAAGG